ncbi:beta-lactamase (plasmid) [Gemmatirosa kalamazoonensis]|uniref:Beta-lactamase n=1 Tax=Gemmatirosa kalamazoonensis TaxID=861299 RepID=W0RNI1_9BACT|nr:serine hydrolase domain-containing protein [Gemmatirosa kalamazoonensis]AHG92296.1 beta-lactamase [Gemmatirosa kalamazoonensis]
MMSVASVAGAQPNEAAVDSIMSAYARPGMPGAAVLVVHDGRVVLEKGYGLADVEANTPVTRETDFRLASLTKQFTATAIMLLAADGRVRYDDPVTKWVPNLPAYARGVTLRHLLHHTGGLPDYEDFVPDSQTRQVLDAEIPALVAHSDTAYFAPGTRFRYSNTGYVLLALVVERASGTRFADFLRDRVFATLGMSGSLAREDRGPPVPRRAYGYTVRTSGVRRTDQSNTSATLGDGGVYTSVRDLAKWDAALDRHQLVSADAQRLAWTPPARLPTGDTAPFAGAGYGFGWFVDHESGELRVRHHGESRGFTNAVVRYPDRRLAVWILTNRTGGAPWDLAQRIAELYR